MADLTDDFGTRTEAPLYNSGMWETIIPSYGINCTGGTCYGSNTGTPPGLSCSAITTTERTFDADQYCSITNVYQNTFDFLGLGVRLSTTGGGQGYVLIANYNGYELRLLTAGALGTIIDSTNSLAPQASHVLRIEANGTTISASINSTVLSGTNSTYSSGQPGIFYDTQNVQGTLGDNFSAGDYAATTTISFDGVTNSKLYDIDQTTLIASMTDVAWEVYNGHTYAPKGSLIEEGTGATITNGVLVLSLSSSIGSAADVRVELKGTILAGGSGIDQTGETATVSILAVTD